MNLDGISYNCLIGFPTPEYLGFLKLLVVLRFTGMFTCILPVPVNRLNIFALWPAFSNLHGLCGRFTRLRVDGKRNRENIYPVLNLHGYVWTGP